MYCKHDDQRRLLWLLFNVPATDGPRCLVTVQPFETPDHLETTLTVPDDGRFSWHVNPSTRPFLLKPTVLPGEITTTTQTFAGDGQVNPNSADVSPETSEIVHEFTVGPTDGTVRLALDLSWEIAAEDFDLRLCYVVSESQCDPIGTGSSGPGSSGNVSGIPEHIEVREPPPPVGTYRATVVRYATARDDYTLTVTREGSAGSTVVPGRREPWVMTCETPEGKILQTAQVIVDRGMTATVNLKACSKKSA